MSRQPEAIGLFANRDLRVGPDSLLIRFIRELEPYLRHVLKPDIYALEGTYRALLRYGLLHDYPHLYPLPSGRRGGLVVLANMVVANRDPEGEGKTRSVDRVVYLADPRDPTSIFPDSLALKRECVVTGKTFLATHSAACEWYSLQWHNTEDAGKPHPSVSQYFLPQALLDKVLPAVGTGIHRQTIALIAHDTKKKEMLQFAAANFAFLEAFQTRLATGTTGTLLNGQLPQRLVEAWEELEEEVQAFEKLGQVPRRLTRAMEEKRQLEAMRQQLSERLGGKAWVCAQPSGPRGGDIQIADILMAGSDHKVLFFEDPHVSREHEADIQLMERTTRIPERDVLCLHEAGSAREWARNWQQCMERGTTNPVTLFRAYRLLWGVELVLADLGKEMPDGKAEEEEIWQDIVAKAAWYIFGLVAERAHAQLAEGDKARVAVTWGYEMHEVIDALRKVPVRLEQLDQERPQLSRCLAEEHFRVPRNVIVLPTVGIMGTTDPRNEANYNAGQLGALFGGEALSLPHYAFYEERYKQEVQDAIKEKIGFHWDRLDVAILSCDHIKRHFSSRSTAPLPAKLHTQMASATVGEIGGMYLERLGTEAVPKDYIRVGMSYHQLQNTARRRGAVLIAGAQRHRIEPALAALQGGLVSVFVTNLAFAWAVLNTYAGVAAARNQP